MPLAGCRLTEVMSMTEKKQKRYPTDRLKLHALLKVNPPLD